jgi:hypothetical protein
MDWRNQAMKNKRTVFGISCLSIIAIGAMLILWFQFGVIQPYNEFLRKEQQIKPLLDTLNSEVENQLPPLPTGSKLEDKTFYGLDNSSFYKAHGRWLTLNISTSLSRDDISLYYRSDLVEKGWMENREQRTYSSFLYYRGTSCINLEIPGNDSYSIVIWHDYEKQTFSPPIPEKSITQFFEFGRNVAKCP